MGLKMVGIGFLLFVIGDIYLLYFLWVSGGGFSGMFTHRLDIIRYLFHSPGGLLYCGSLLCIYIGFEIHLRTKPKH
jgi:hypothetical protein